MRDRHTGCRRSRFCMAMPNVKCNNTLHDDVCYDDNDSTDKILILKNDYSAVILLSLL